MRSLFGSQGPGPLSLVLSGISSAMVYGALLVYFPLLTTYEKALQNLNNLNPAEWPKGLLLIICIGLLFGGYGLGAMGVSAARRGSLAPLLIVGFPLLFVALLLLVQPATSTDVYDYLFRGRMLAHYRANTFTIVPQEYASDPLLKYVAWKHAVTAYGPLWERVSWLTARLAGEAPGSLGVPATHALLRLILAYKGLAALGFLLCGAAVWVALRHVAPEQRWLGVYLWLWNPLALWETVAAAHNDVWMALLIVLALWAFGRGQGDKVTRRQGDIVTGQEVPGRPLTPSPPHPLTLSVAAFLALTAGGLIKFVAFFFGPVLLAGALRRLPTWRDRGRLVLLGGLACAVFVVLAYAQFWVGWETVRNVGDRRSLFNISWLAVLRVLLEGVVSEERAQTIAAWSGLALLLVGVAWASWRSWRAPQEVAAHLLWLVLWFLFVCNPWFQPWYVIWALALAALQPWRTRVVWAVGLFCCTALVSYIVGGLLLPALHVPSETAARELLLSICTYGPPLIVLGWGRSLHLVAWWRSLLRLPQAEVRG